MSMGIQKVQFYKSQIKAGKKSSRRILERSFYIIISSEKRRKF